MEYPINIETYGSGNYWYDITGTAADAEAWALAVTTTGYMYQETLTDAVPSGIYTKLIPEKEIRRVVIFPAK